MELLIISIGLMFLVAVTGVVVTLTVYVAMMKRMERMRHDSAEYESGFHREDE